ncbi:MAG: hypothetical protein HYY16_16810 [Planctomycetes bacterium]|nr:hypothetical protein [Planctomycetota bacterium]
MIDARGALMRTLTWVWVVALHILACVSAAGQDRPYGPEVDRPRLFTDQEAAARQVMDLLGVNTEKVRVTYHDGGTATARLATARGDKAHIEVNLGALQDIATPPSSALFHEFWHYFQSLYYDGGEDPTTCEPRHPLHPTAMGCAYQDLGLRLGRKNPFEAEAYLVGEALAELFARPQKKRIPDGFYTPPRKKILGFIPWPLRNKPVPVNRFVYDPDQPFIRNSPDTFPEDIRRILSYLLPQLEAAWEGTGKNPTHLNVLRERMEQLSAVENGTGNPNERSGPKVAQARSLSTGIMLDMARMSLDAVSWAPPSHDTAQEEAAEPSRAGVQSAIEQMVGTP